MGKHSLQKDPRLPGSVKGVLVMGAVAASTGAMPAIPAMAQTTTVDVPGVGKFNVDVPDQYKQQVEQLGQQAGQGLQQFQKASATPPPAAAPAPAMPDLQQIIHGSNNPGDIALDHAKQKVGAMYSWGAAGPQTFDCSGLVQWAFKQAGIKLPRTSFEQSHVGAPVAYENLRPGDIVITNGGGHVGIYAGDGKLLNAVQSGSPVTYTNLHAKDVMTARRVA